MLPEIMSKIVCLVGEVGGRREGLKGEMDGRGIKYMNIVYWLININIIFK